MTNLPHHISLTFVVYKFIRWIILKWILNGAKDRGLDLCCPGRVRQKTLVYQVMHIGFQKGMKFLDKANEESLLNCDCGT
jgi:hypothetical protein